ncbi:helix-turn-helix domain-containing protein [Edwardsiella piscicida]|uniref:helix-turn-helix domain-containing protein n=1 Tax=Edwardsiella piscicida TaxID=1263550 RepID=UPI000D51DAE6|nr:helix-turn-helix transcriptional regulator [Edwardsiella piscicida]UCQ39646.1 helix-turn-helix domain-containing protein [Edwardsiella piscicida]
MSEKTTNTFSSEGIERFGERLRSAIGAESVNAFAKRCGISEATIRKYMSGNTYPGIDKMHSLSKSTGKSISWLISGDEESLVKKNEPSHDELLKWWGIIFDSLNSDEKQVIISQYQRHGVNALFSGVLDTNAQDGKEILRRGHSPESTAPAPKISTHSKKAG